MPGTPGTAGEPGPSPGPASGDLTGSYPAPTIAPGAITASKLGQFPAVRAELGATSQSIPTGGATALAFNSERFDTADLHDTSANQTRLTASIAGIYEIMGGIDWANVTGERTIAITANNTSVLARERDDANGISRHAQSISTLYALAAGDYVELEGTQTSGGPLDAVAFPTTYLAMRWVSSAP